MPLSGEDLKRRRLEVGVSESDLVEMTSLTQTTIRTIETMQDLPPAMFKIIANKIDECVDSKAENDNPGQTVTVNDNPGRTGTVQMPEQYLHDIRNSVRKIKLSLLKEDLSTVDKGRVREQQDMFYPETLEDIDALGLLALKLIRNDC